MKTHNRLCLAMVSAVGWGLFVFTLLFAALGTLSALADDPSIENVTVQQRYPWNGQVDVTYTVTGDIEAYCAEAGLTNAGLVVHLVDRPSGRTVVATPAALSGLSLSPGTHTVTWDLDAEGVRLNSKKVDFYVSCSCDFKRVETTEEYHVIDLSGGPEAESYPVTITNAVPPGGWTDEYKTTNLVLRLIPSGAYRMQGREEVILTKPFLMGVFEVTQRQYELVMGTNPSGYKTGDEAPCRPVEQVSYDMIRGSVEGSNWPVSDAVDGTSFVGRLRTRTGRSFDLPTEAQWEYACRAGSMTTYYWGNVMTNAYCWYLDNMDGTTHPAGLTLPNAWGLYDMSGNVFEWCLDRNGTLRYGMDPKGPYSGTERVFRGGAAPRPATDSASYYREGRAPYSTSSGVGFRLCGAVP